MRLKLISFLLGLLVLAGCESTDSSTDGQRIYWIKQSDSAAVQFRMLDSVNALRSAAGLSPVALSAELNAAAATHARDMSLQNRPWHFGSDGTSPIDRAVRAGHPGRFIGEAISETYETETETLAAWMTEEGSRTVILDERAAYIGFAWFQEKSGKLWWVLDVAS